MSYALRNTIYLSVTLLLMITSGWAFIYFTQTEKLEERETAFVEKEAELQSLESSSENYSVMLKGFLDATYKVENHEKELMADNRVPPVYDYVRTVNDGVASTEVNFNWNDSTAQDQYGINQFRVSGVGSYRNLFNFIQRLERSRLLYKINSLQLQNVNELERMNYVSFEFNVDSYYNKMDKEYESSLDFNRTSIGISHNPFYPLIRDVPPNEDNLLNVDESRLIALSRRNAYLVNQQGSLQTLGIGAQVYLGQLENINDDSVTFVLNKGGITERVTMEIETQL